MFTRAPVLFLVFNRPALTKRVFDRLRTIKPPRLYVAADGPRYGMKEDNVKCQAVRDIISAVDWSCDVFTLVRETNLGCKAAVSSGIDWFFETEEEGIILEDDCLPHPDFFWFADTLLMRYKEDDRVSVITGDNFQSGKARSDASYYFSRYNHCWGWATWRRAWRDYDGAISFWPEWKKSEHWRDLFRDSVERAYWSEIFDRVYDQNIDSWAYPWTASVWFHGGLTATPNVNLVENIGFGPDAAHTINEKQQGKVPVRSLKTMTHPNYVCVHEQADRYTFNYHFGGYKRRWPWKVLLPVTRLISYGLGASRG